ncbi:hypothetical protein G6F36_013199 [Rhizopus arrhizus]|nr:hypothetical protein G6F36_013199 [Rhizopus arrhizus]
MTAHVVTLRFNLQIHPQASLDYSAKIFNLKLTHLPLIPKEEVPAGLQQSLAGFGEIMNVGISTESSTGFFSKYSKNYATKLVDVKPMTSFMRLGIICQLDVDIVTRLQPFLWGYILNDAPTLANDRTAESLSQQFRNQRTWQKFSSRKFRPLGNTNNYHSRIGIAQFRIKNFWNAPMLLQVRSVWYRVLNFKLPTMSYQHHIHNAESSQYKLCHADEDTIEHFMVFCPPRQFVWNSVLQSFYPELLLQLEHLWILLRSLNPPPLFLIYKI